MDFDGFRELLKVTTPGPLTVAQAFLANLRAGAAPRILSVSSKMAWMGYAKSERIAYRASKVTLNTVMQGLAKDLEPEGIPVVLIDPGWARTDMGGAGAELDPTVVPSGILALAETLAPEMSGGSYIWRGAARAF